jgi:hypothetical protein
MDPLAPLFEHRDLTNKAQKGKLTSRDIPMWLVARHYTAA